MYLSHPLLLSNSKQAVYLLPYRGNPGTEIRVIHTIASFILLLIITGCSEVQRDFTKAPPAQPSSKQIVTGKWIDIDTALNEAVADKNVLMSVISTDRWESLIIYELRTNQDNSATLMVIRHPDCNSDKEICNIVLETRVGRFRDADAEIRLLSAIKQQFDNLY